MKSIARQLTTLVTLALLAVVTCTIGCTPAAKTTANNGGAGASGKQLRIAVIPKGTSHEFWKSVHYGAQQAANEIGNVEIIWRGPVVESDTGSQIEVVKSMVTMQVDGIVLAPNLSLIHI